MQRMSRGGFGLRARSALAIRAVGGLAALTLVTTAGCRGKSAEDKGADAAVAAAPTPAPSAPMDAIPLKPEQIAKLVNPQKLPPYSGPTGSVEGTVRIQGPASPDSGSPSEWAACADAQKTYGKLFREGAPEADGSRPVADAVVAVTGYSGYYVPEADKATLVTIEPCAFTARTVTMTLGQRLDIVNHGKDYWAPVVQQLPMPALMLAPPNGEAIRLYPDKPGHFTIMDRMKHTWATADLYVMLHPLHAVSDTSGHFRIDGVPVGKLKVSSRLTAIGEETTKDVEILAGVVQKVDLVLTYTPKTLAVPSGMPVGDGGRPREQIK